MYTILTGAAKNAGDFLIMERGKALLQKYAKPEGILQLDRWQPLDNRIKEMNKTKAVILCGGPGYARNFQKNMFPATRGISGIKVPIIPFGLGWIGYPMWHPDKFSFDRSSKSLLKPIHQNCQATSCRDYITKEILERHGFDNVIMTGCPGLYDLESIGKKFERPKEVYHVAISMGAPPHPSIKLLQEACQFFKHLNSRAKLYAVFHRGIKQDESTSKEEAKDLQIVAACAEELGYSVVDASYGASQLEIYRKCDLHVGFRVHAHVFCLSVRKPSFLLQIDGRGRGLSETLGLPDIPLTNKSNVSLAANLMNYISPRAIRALGKIKIARKIKRNATLNRSAVETVMQDIEHEFANGFPRFEKLDVALDSHFKDMVRFLSTLP